MKITCSKCEGYLELDRIGLQRYCRPCHAENVRLNRSPYGLMTPEQRKKDNCRSYAGVYVRKGKLPRQPCEKCGNEKAEMHHEDYDKPLEVIWLCRTCHLDLHTQRNRKEAESKELGSQNN